MSKYVSVCVCLLPLFLQLLLSAIFPSNNLSLSLSFFEELGEDVRGVFEGKRLHKEARVIRQQELHLC